jgi:hypothetical protein
MTENDTYSESSILLPPEICRDLPPYSSLPLEYGIFVYMSLEPENGIIEEYKKFGIFAISHLCRLRCLVAYPGDRCHTIGIDREMSEFFILTVSECMDETEEFDYIVRPVGIRSSCEYLCLRAIRHDSLVLAPSCDRVPGSIY